MTKAQKDSGTQAAEGSAGDAQAIVDASLAEEPADGDLVELHDGRYAILLSPGDDEEQRVLPLGTPELYGLPLRKVG